MLDLSEYTFIKLINTGYASESYRLVPEYTYILVPYDSNGISAYNFKGAAGMNWSEPIKLKGIPADTIGITHGLIFRK